VRINETPVTPSTILSMLAEREVTAA
jgi:hypothetical protein